MGVIQGQVLRAVLRYHLPVASVESSSATCRSVPLAFLGESEFAALWATVALAARVLPQAGAEQQVAGGVRRPARPAALHGRRVRRDVRCW